MKQIAGPRMASETVSQCIYRAGRKLGLSRRQSLRAWYGQRDTIPTELMDRARELAAAETVAEAKNEYAELAARIARLEALLVQDADFHRPGVDAFRQAVGGLRRAVGG